MVKGYWETHCKTGEAGKVERPRRRPVRRVWKGDILTQEATETGDIIPGLIVRHTSRRLGKLNAGEACERLVSGRISFSEFVDQVGEDHGEILAFMMEHDLHPGRPEEVFFSIDIHASAEDRGTLLSQLGDIYSRSRCRKVC